jgi:hypothetical protein
MGGSFNSMGRGYAYRRDPIAEQNRREAAAAQAASYRARVVGRRVTVTADIDFGRSGEIVDVVDGMLAVRLDGETEPNYFQRAELEAAR